MDNFQLDVLTEGKEQLLRVFALLSKHRAVGFRIAQKGSDKSRVGLPPYPVWEADTLILYWSDTTGVSLFPTPMSCMETTDMVWRWLATVPGHFGSGY
jgi:hypothetical protein